MTNRKTFHADQRFWKTAMLTRLLVFKGYDSYCKPTVSSSICGGGGGGHV